MEFTIYIIIGIIIGLATGILISNTKATAQKKLQEAEINHLNKKIEENKQTAEKEKQAMRLNDEQIISTERKTHIAEIANIKESYEKQTQQLKEQIASERQYATQMREENDKQWMQKFEVLKQEMQKNAAEQLAAKQKDLQENNRIQIDELLKPLKEQFADFKRTVEESKTMNEVNKKELQSTFETTMKLFQQEQQQTVSLLKEQTLKIGSDAANLTKALKG